MEDFKLNTIEEAIADFREGKFLIVVDDEDRENEGDFIIAAEKITPEAVNFMQKQDRGVLCVPLTLLHRCIHQRPCRHYPRLGRPNFHPIHIRTSRTYQSALCTG